MASAIIAKTDSVAIVSKSPETMSQHDLLYDFFSSLMQFVLLFLSPIADRNIP